MVREDKNRERITSQREVGAESVADERHMYDRGMRTHAALEEKLQRDDKEEGTCEDVADQRMKQEKLDGSRWSASAHNVHIGRRRTRRCEVNKIRDENVSGSDFVQQVLRTRGRDG